MHSSTISVAGLQEKNKHMKISSIGRLIFGEGGIYTDIPPSLSPCWIGVGFGIKVRLGIGVRVRV